MNKYLIVFLFLILSIPAKPQSEPVNTKLMGIYDTLNLAYKVIINDQYAFICDLHSEMVVLNIGDPFYPFKVASVDSFTNFSSLQIEDTLCFIGGQEKGYLYGLSIYNISDPTKPNFISFYQTDAEVLGTAYKNNFLFLATSGGIMSVNISDPANPLFSDFLLLPGAWRLEIKDDYAFVLAQYSGLFIVDISSPNNLVQINFVNTSGSGLFIKNNLLFICGAENVAIYNISDIFNINLVGFFSPGSGYQATDIYADDTFAYISANGGGCRILDISNPSVPTEIGYYPISCAGIDVVNNKIYLAAGAHGFYIIGLMPIVLSPNGGEYWDMGNEKVIKWIEESIDLFDIYYSLDGGLNWIEIVTDYNETEFFYNWIIPSTPSSNCKVKINDSAEPFFSDSSDGVFTIKTLSLLNPNNKDTLLVGSVYDIKWIADPSIYMIDIDLSTDGGFSWISSISGAQIASRGIYNWTVPNLQSDNCKIQIREIGGQVYDISDSTFIITSGTNLEDVDHSIVFSFSLAQNYPNPLNPSTVISFSIKYNGLVKLNVYDILGKKVAELVNEVKEAGNHSIVFNASNLPSGIYFYSLTSGNFTATKKLILLK